MPLTSPHIGREGKPGSAGRGVAGRGGDEIQAPPPPTVIAPALDPLPEGWSAYLRSFNFKGIAGGGPRLPLILCGCFSLLGAFGAAAFGILSSGALHPPVAGLSGPRSLVPVPRWSVPRCRAGAEIQQRRVAGPTADAGQPTVKLRTHRRGHALHHVRTGGLTRPALASEPLAGSVFAASIGLRPVPWRHSPSDHLPCVSLEDR